MPLNAPGYSMKLSNSALTQHYIQNWRYWSSKCLTMFLSIPKVAYTRWLIKKGFSLLQIQ